MADRARVQPLLANTQPANQIILGLVCFRQLEKVKGNPRVYLFQKSFLLSVVGLNAGHRVRGRRKLRLWHRLPPRRGEPPIDRAFPDEDNAARFDPVFRWFEEIQRNLAAVVYFDGHAPCVRKRQRVFGKILQIRKPNPKQDECRKAHDEKSRFPQGSFHSRG